MMVTPQYRKLEATCGCSNQFRQTDVATGFANGAVKLFDLLSGKEATIRCGSAILAVEFISAEELLLLPANGKSLLHLQLSNLARLNSVAKHASNVCCFTSSGRRVATGCAAGSLTVWQMNAQQTARQGLQKVSSIDKAHVGAVSAVLLHGELLISGGNDQFVRIWSVSQGALMHEFAVDAAKITCLLAFRVHSATLLASGSADGTIFVFSLAPSLAAITSLPDSDSACTCLSATRDGRVLAAGHADGTAAFTAVQLAESSSANNAPGFAFTFLSRDQVSESAGRAVVSSSFVHEPERLLIWLSDGETKLWPQIVLDSAPSAQKSPAPAIRAAQAAPSSAASASPGYEDGKVYVLEGYSDSEAGDDSNGEQGEEVVVETKAEDYDASKYADSPVAERPAWPAESNRAVPIVAGDAETNADENKDEDEDEEMPRPLPTPVPHPRAATPASARSLTLTPRMASMSPAIESPVRASPAGSVSSEQLSTPQAERRVPRPMQSAGSSAASSERSFSVTPPSVAAYTPNTQSSARSSQPASASSSYSNNVSSSNDLARELYDASPRSDSVYATPSLNSSARLLHEYQRTLEANFEHELTPARLEAELAAQKAARKSLAARAINIPRHATVFDPAKLTSLQAETKRPLKSALKRADGKQQSAKKLQASEQAAATAVSNSAGGAPSIVVNGNMSTKQPRQLQQKATAQKPSTAATAAAVAKPPLAAAASPDVWSMFNARALDVDQPVRVALGDAELYASLGVRHPFADAQNATNKQAQPSGARAELPVSVSHVRPGSLESGSFLLERHLARWFA